MDLISNKNYCQHCKVKGTLQFEDLDNLIAYNVVMGLKNADMIKYMFEHIDIETEEFTTVNIQELILRYRSFKRNTATATKA